jgi:predicted nucleic acid-binding protein
VKKGERFHFAAYLRAPEENIGNNGASKKSQHRKRLLLPTPALHLLTRALQFGRIDHHRYSFHSCEGFLLVINRILGGEEERKTLRDSKITFPGIPLTDEIWEEACELAGRCRKAGKTAPAADILITACARHHGVEVETADVHFEILMKL